MDILFGEFTREEMVAIFNHSFPGSPFWNIYAEYRAVYYGSTSTPDNRIDGDKFSGSYSDILLDADRYRTKINADIAAGSPVELSITGRLDATEGFVVVSAEAVDPIGFPNLHINVAVVEDHIMYGGADWRYILRYMPLDESISIPSVGDTAATARNFVYDPAWIASNLRVVAYVQSDPSFRVLQAVYFDGTPPMTVSSVPISSACTSGTPPRIDGIYSASEWSAADETYVPITYYVNFPFYVYTMNDDTYLYICVDAAGDRSLTGSHHAGIFFDTDEDALLTIDAEDGVQANYGGVTEYKNWDGSDRIVRSTSPLGVPFIGGTHDEAGMIGAVGFGDSDREPQPHLIYEFKIPLALGQLNAVMGDSLRPFIYIYGNQEESYWDVHTNPLDPASYGHMTLATCITTPITNHKVIAIFLILFSGIILISGKLFS
jgi:hypothetical protein